MLSSASAPTVDVAIPLEHFYQLFEQQASYPDVKDKIAIYSNDSEKTYAELNKKKPSAFESLRVLLSTGEYLPKELVSK